MYQNEDKRIQIDQHKIVINDPKGSLRALRDHYFKGIDTVDELYIQAQNLQFFPEALLKIVVCKRIFLSNAYCRSIPRFVYQSTALQQLELDCSQVRQTDELSLLHNLKELHIHNLYGKKWPQTISQLKRLKSLSISKKFGKKCTDTNILQAIKASKSIESLQLLYTLDLCLLQEDIYILNKLKKLDFESDRFNDSSLHLAALDKVFIYQDWAQKNSIREFQDLNFKASFLHKKILFALFFKHIECINRLLSTPFESFDVSTSNFLCFSKRPSRNLQARIRKNLPKTSLSNISKGHKSAIFVINAHSNIQELYTAMQAGVPLATEDQLKDWLTKLESPWLRQEGSKQSVIQIIELIVSNQPENILLALQLLDGNGATDELISMTAALMMAHPHKKVASEAQKLFRKIGPASAYDHLKNCKIYLRRSSNTAAKLKQLFQVNFGILEMPFRVLHAFIAGQNPSIRDARKATLNIQNTVFKEPFPSLIAHFKTIKKIKLLKCQHLDTKTAFEAMAQIQQLLWLDISGCKTSVDKALAQLRNLQYLDLSDNRIDNSQVISALTQLTHLNLEGCKIKSFDFLVDLPQLQYLNLGRNQLKKIPDAVWKLKNLRVLILKQNRIENIPAAIEQSKVRELNLSGNRIEQLHPALWRIKDLKKLDLKTNRIHSFDIAQYPSFLHSKLQELDLSNNQLNHFRIGPEQLRQLSVLDISKNQLTQLDDSIFRYTSISKLVAAYNQIEAIPGSIKNRNFRSINLRGNGIKHLPAVLTDIYVERFDLRDNQIISIDDNILQNSALHHFYQWNLEGNPIRSLFKFS